MLEGVEVRLGVDFFRQREELKTLAYKIIFTGMIDEYFDYCYGELEYRSLRFETEVLDTDNFQGNAVVNYTEYEIPYTRIIEHKHFELGCQSGEANPRTVVTKEYPAEWKRGDEPYYPMNDDRNNELYARYKALADRENNVVFGGRLGMYRYFDMNNIVDEALKCAARELP
jgi:UDP-galactopyranose mutase